jgi:hypothetical protein
MPPPAKSATAARWSGFAWAEVQAVATGQYSSVTGQQNGSVKDSWLQIGCDPTSLCFLMVLSICLLSLSACVVVPAPAYGRAWVPAYYNGWHWVPGHWA